MKEFFVTEVKTPQVCEIANLGRNFSNQVIPTNNEINDVAEFTNLGRYFSTNVVGGQLNVSKTG